VTAAASGLVADHGIDLFHGLIERTPAWRSIAPMATLMASRASREPGPPVVEMLLTAVFIRAPSPTRPRQTPPL
jgi:hypothetical protein